MKIIVFGASGFVGGWICEVLNTDSDIDLLACVRRWAGASRLARRGIEMTQVDLDSSTDLIEILRGADAVINATVPPADREPELALRLYKACAKSGVSRFIQFSSAALYGDLTGKVEENIRPEPIDSYGRGKAQMEQSLLTAATKGGPQLFILRPSIIYGPYSDTWTVRYAQRIANGRWRTLGRFGVGTCNLIHAHDVARAAILCITSNVSPGSHVLNINGPDIISWNEYIERFGDALGITDRVTPTTIKLATMTVGSEVVRSIGKWVLKHFQRLIRRVTLSGGAGPAMMASAKSFTNRYPTLEEIKLLCRKVRYISDRAERTISFQPVVRLADGLKQSADWCRTHGVI